jgi:hypothetical protein
MIGMGSWLGSAEVNNRTENGQHGRMVDDEEVGTVASRGDIAH